MDYITRYYKNLSEQLQAQTNQLKRILTEMEAANLQTFNVEFDATPQGDYNQADSGLQPVMAGTNNYDPNQRRTNPGAPIGKNGDPQQGYDPNQRYVIIAPGGKYFIMTGGDPAVMYGPFTIGQDPSGFGYVYPTDIDLGNPYWVFSPGRGVWHIPGTEPSDPTYRWKPNRWFH